MKTNKAHKLRGLLTTFQASENGTVEPPKEIELLRTGSWDTPYHGRFDITEQNLRNYAAHAKDPNIRRALPVDREHDTIGGAAGWLGEDEHYQPKDLDVRANDAGGFSLWASANWTPQGAQDIRDRVYRFFSPEFADRDYEDPEQAGVYYDDVLIGGGLTNRPLFKHLTAVAASDGTGADGLTESHKQNIIYLSSEEQNSMNLKDLLAKKHEDLSAEEKAFIVEHKGELNDDQLKAMQDAGVVEKDGDGNETAEQKAEREKQEADAKAQADADAQAKADADAAAAAGNGDGNGDGSGTQARDGVVTIKANELKKLQDDAAAGRQAHDTLAHKEVVEHVGSLLFNEKTGGKLPIQAKDTAVKFYESLNTDQRKQFNDLLEKMPNLKMFGEVGDGGTGSTTDPSSATAQVMEKSKALMASDEGRKTGLTLASAQSRVLADKANAELAKQFSEERKAKREGKN